MHEGDLRAAPEVNDYSRMRKRTILILGLAVFTCVAMIARPPFKDSAVLEPGPVYAPLLNPPPAINEGAVMDIGWDVLTGQWALV